MLFYRALKVRSLFLRNILEFYCVISYVANASEVILFLRCLLQLHIRRFCMLMPMQCVPFELISSSLSSLGREREKRAEGKTQLQLFSFSVEI